MHPIFEAIRKECQRARLRGIREDAFDTAVMHAVLAANFDLSGEEVDVSDLERFLETLREQFSKEKHESN